MSDFFKDFLPEFLSVMSKLLISQNREFLLKGGQAIAMHMHEAGLVHHARYSIDLDIALSDEDFPFDQEDFKEKIVSEYNSDKSLRYCIKPDIKIKRIPLRETRLFFGYSMSIKVSKRREDGRCGGRREENHIFPEIGSPEIKIDFSCNDVVEGFYHERDDKIRIAMPELIIAEKIRALCTQIEGVIAYSEPKRRPKDFFDIFLLYNIYYRKENISNSQLEKIIEAIKICFNKKKVSLGHIETLFSDEVKTFHELDFRNQVINTLPVESMYSRVEYNRVYSDATEFIEKILTHLNKKH